MLLSYAALIGGLALLIFAGDFLVRGAVSIAQSLGIPTLVIGLTIVAFGTSAPELFISLKAAMDGVSGVAIGNVVGSNIANVLLVLGVPALIAITPCDETGAHRNALFMIVISIVFTGMCFIGTLNRLTGIVLLLLLCVFLADSVHTTRKHKKAAMVRQQVMLKMRKTTRIIWTSIPFQKTNWLLLSISCLVWSACLWREPHHHWRNRCCRLLGCF